MRKLLLAVATLLIGEITAHAQSVQQSGTVTPGHTATWVTNGVIRDGGSPVTGSVTANDAACITSGGSLTDCGVPLAAGVGSGFLLVGGSNGKPVWVPLSGDCTIASTGAITCPSTQGISLGGAPTSGQVLIGQSSTAYSPKTMSGDCSIGATGQIQCLKTGGTAFGPLATQSLPAAVNQGGTGNTTLTANAVLLGSGTSAVQTAPIGTAGRLLMDHGVSTNPTFTAMSGDCTISTAGVIDCYSGTPASVAEGGTGASTLTSHGVLVGAGTSAVSGLTAGTSGQVLLGVTSANPAFGTMSGSCSITNAGVITCLPKIKYTLFTSTGGVTYTADTHLIMAKLECIGGGGSGGGAAGSATGLSSGGGGGGGSYAMTWATAAAIGTSQTVTIATAAAAGTAGNNPGSAGGDASIGSLVVAKGGSAGGGAGANGVGAGGLGGIVGTGDFKAVGQPGGFGLGASITTVKGPSGHGGGTVFGGGATAVSASGAGAAGSPGTVFGSGGSGGQSQGDATDEAGGAGALGVCMVTEFLSQ